MIDFLKFIITAIVDQPDAITLDETVDETNTHLITLTVAPEDMGKVIGKGGKIISAIRELLKVKAIKQGQRVRLTLQDPSQTDQPSLSELPETPPQKS